MVLRVLNAKSAGQFFGFARATCRKLENLHTNPIQLTNFECLRSFRGPIGDVMQISEQCQPIQRAVDCAVGTVKGLTGKGALIDINTLLNRQTPAVRSAFEELQKVIISRNPGKNNDINRITLLANEILTNEHYAGNETEMLRYIRDFKHFAEMKDVSGAPLLGSNFIKYMADPVGMPAQKFKDLRNLVRAAKRGYINKCMFNESNWYKYADSINLKMKEDIELLKQAKARGINPIELFIPKMKTPTDWYHLKPGTIYQDLDGRCAVRCTGHQIVQLNVDRDTLFKLMPPIGRYFSAQNMSGTCYNLTAINGMLQSPKSMGYLLGCIYSENGKLMIKMPFGSTPKENIFCGKFKDFHPQGRVQTELKNGVYQAVDQTQTVRSNPLIQALETLYGSHRKYTRADKYIRALQSSNKDWKSEYNYLLKNMDNTIIYETENGSLRRFSLEEFYRFQTKCYNMGLLKVKPTQFKSANDYYKEAGQAKDVFKYFMHNHIGGRMYPRRINITQPASSNDLYMVRRLLEQENPIRYFATLPGDSDKVMLYQEKALARRHAYFIESYDRATDTVTYINPWNSALTYKMQLKDLLQYLSKIDLCYA